MSAYKKICAGIVLYNPDLERLMDNIDNIVAQVDKVFLVDNGSVNIKQVKHLCEYSEKISLICNARNMGIAMALNQLTKAAESQGYTWILTLDQDSICQSKLIETYEKYIEMPDVGMLTCNIIDRNFGVESYTKKSEYEECNFCITSGALLSINAWEKVGGFDNKMFIDKVDYDLCLSMRERGIKIVRVNYNGLLHEIGHAKKINIGKIQLIFFNHGPFRRYYIARNAIYCAKKHKSLSLAKEFLIATLDIFLVFVFEKNKLEKLKSGLKGLHDGFLLEVDA